MARSPLSGSPVTGELYLPVRERGVIPLWARGVVILGALLLVAGAGIAVFRPAMLVSPTDEINGAVHIYAGYVFSRNLALAVLLLAALGLRARNALHVLTLLTSFVQVLDGLMDGVEGRWPIVPGVILLAALFFAASLAIAGHPFWRRAAWGTRF